MSNKTVEQLANDIGISVDRLLTQMSEAGLDIKTAQQEVSEEQKRHLLGFLQQSHGNTDVTQPKKITLRRKTKNTLKLGSDPRSKKTVNIEVRQKRTYVKKSLLQDEPAPEPEEIEPTVEPVIEAIAEPEIVDAAATTTPEKTLTAPSEDQLTADVDDAAEIETETEQAAKPVAEETAPAASPEAKDKVKSQKNKRKEKAKEKQFEDGSSNKASRKKKYHKGTSKRRVTTRAAREASESLQHGFEKPAARVVQKVNIPETITVAELAKRMAVKATEVIKTMMKMGAMATINQVIDQDTAVIVTEEMGHIPIALKENAVEDRLVQTPENQSDAISRAPVVTIMGHVDHGKTSLLDFIRRAKVTASEAGGITQHIGAYHVNTPKGSITFIDTPGHAAFTAMRARGAKVTDIVILIVAADDGVKPQTIEAIQHAKAAGVPILVAVNKIDKPDADPERIKTELSNYDVIPEAWGGDVMFMNISAKSGEGIDPLLDAILLQAEVLELTAVASGPAKGVVIESRLDKGRGPVSTVLIQSGSLAKGDILLAGLEYGRVRAIVGDGGVSVQNTGPSIPVEVLGLSGVTTAGDEAIVVADERKAREVALFRQGKFRDVKLARSRKTSLENIFDNIKDGDHKSLNIVLKADVQGSLEAITDALTKLGTDEVKVEVISTAVGGITESDINLALASGAIVIGFNVRADAAARRLAEAESVSLNYYSVIYDVVDQIKLALTGMLAPKFKEEIVGIAEVRNVFRSPKIGAIAGCKVIEGNIKRNNPIRVLRDSVVIYQGSLESLRRFKDDVLDVRNGMECGIGVKNYNDVKVGDLIEVFETVEVKRQL